MLASNAVKVWRGAEATERMSDEKFRSDWRQLYETCPWATGGQDPTYTYIHSLYHSANAEHAIVEQRVDNQLVGLLALNRQKGVAAPIGAGDCEYAVWLSDRERADTFVPAALNALLEDSSWPKVSFQYLPPNTPLSWIDAGWRSRIDLKPFTTTVLPLTSQDQIRQFVRSKKSLRSLSNQLARLGRVDFRQIDTVDLFTECLETFAALYDARKMAKHGGAPFRDNPSKKAYLTELMRAGLQHATSLELNGKIIAAHIGIKDRMGGMFSLAGIAHDEAYARFSPGSILLTHLIPLLYREGYSAFDLTPGGDEYKARWGTQTRVAYDLTVFPSQIKKLSNATQRVAKAALRRVSEARQRFGFP